MDTLKAWWFLIVPLVAFVSWCARMDYMVREMKTDIDAIRATEWEQRQEAGVSGPGPRADAR